MDIPEEWIKQVIEQTYIVRMPKAKLATFGVTNLRYYLVTKPSYQDLIKSEPEGIIRDGRVIAQKPQIVTPAYMLNLDGFGSNARKYMEHLALLYGAQMPGLLYSYKNEPMDTNVVGGEPTSIARRIVDDLNKKGEDNSVVVFGVDAFWDVSLIKAIHEITAASLSSNVNELDNLGLLDIDPALGVPRDTVMRIEGLFGDAEKGGDPNILKNELDRWGLFEQYQDRFLRLFKRK